MVLIMGYLLNHCDDGWGHPTVIPLSGPSWPLSLSADCCQAPLGGAGGPGASARCCHQGTEGTDDAMQLQSLLCIWNLVPSFSHIYALK